MMYGVGSIAIIAAIYSSITYIYLIFPVLECPF